MIGILFFVAVGVWVWASAKLAGSVGNRLVSKQPWRSYAKAFVFVLLMFLIVGDEVIGGFQLRALCRENAVLRIDAEKIKGKRIRLSFEPLDKYLDGIPIRIRWTRRSFRDIATNEELAFYSSYVATGGWFIRMLAMGNSVSPMTIFPSSCIATEAGNLEKKYGFKLVN
jgi:hypothetical protein